MDSYVFLLLLTCTVWLEPGSCVPLSRHRSHSHREERSDEEVFLRFDLATNTTAECVNSVGSNVSVGLSYRTPGGEWMNISSHTPGNCQRSEVEVPLPPNVTMASAVQFRWLQQDQAWGRCNCWQIDNVRITDEGFPVRSFPVSETDLNSDFACYHYGATAANHLLRCPNGSLDQGVVFCLGSASVPRGVVTPMYDLTGNTPSPLNTSCTASDLFEPIGDIELCDGDIEGRLIKVSFQLTIYTDDSNTNNDDGLCDSIESFDEGVELAIRRSEDEQWVPLKFYTSSVSNISITRDTLILIDVGERDEDLSIRGYNVSVMILNSREYITEYICDERFFEEDVQFRWLQTVTRDDQSARDTWFVGNVEITVQRSQSSSAMLFSDDFSSDRTSINSTLWPQVQGGQLGGADAGTGVGTDCVPGGDIVLFFGANDTMFSTTVRRMAVTKPLNLVPDCSKACGVNEVCNGTTGGFVCTCQEGFIRSRNGISCISEEQLEIIEMIIALLDSAAEMPIPTFVSNMLSLLGNLSIRLPPEISERLFNFVSDLIDTLQEDDDDDVDDVGVDAIGSTLLYLMDIFALEAYDPELGELEDTDNIALVHMIQGAMPNDDPTEMVEGITRDGDTILLPREVFMGFNMTNFPVASFRYSNLSGILPDSIPNSQNSNTTMRLASPILSSALQCGPAQCNTRDLNLTNPVVKIFSHRQETVATLQRQDGRNRSMVCVFWDFDDPSPNGLISGQWSTEGCTRNDAASNEFQTVCECNHLTHFALLLSTTEIPLTSAEALSLRIIGIICVTISLVCLTITILTFLFLRSLWSMRNYIHINLCVSLFVAQLTFIVAVEPRGSVAGCQAVAVLLHYFFLVTFMWMLMEGVVLYVALVRVFVEHEKKYLIGFTLASYGIPLLYLCITVPLGFALDNGPHYAGDDPQSCWLRYDTHFIWAFIAPVIVIILANIGFFIMAITIMYRHQRRQTHKSKLETIKHWLKASISLVIVMGITWIIGILVFNRDLLFVAYIYTIFIGLQGLIIFILFVVLSKQVREAYTKWWTVKVASSDFLSKYFGEKSYAIHTASTAVVGSTNKNSLPNDNGKSRGTHNLSPSHDFTDSGRGDLLEKKDNTDFSVTWSASVGLVPVSSGDNTEGGVAVEEEMEALADVLSLEGQRERQSEIENGDVRTSELHVDRK